MAILHHSGLWLHWSWLQDIHIVTRKAKAATAFQQTPQAMLMLSQNLALPHTLYCGGRGALLVLHEPKKWLLHLNINCAKYWAKKGQQLPFTDAFLSPITKQNILYGHLTTLHQTFVTRNHISWTLHIHSTCYTDKTAGKLQVIIHWLIKGEKFYINASQDCQPLCGCNVFQQSTPHQYCDSELNHTTHTHPPVNMWSSVTEEIKLCTVADNKNCLCHKK